MKELHLCSPKGFRASGVCAGLKSRQSPDVGMIVCDLTASAAAVFTTNKVVAAPVKVGRENVANGKLRGIVVNAGNANACTGMQGDKDARRMCQTEIVSWNAVWQRFEIFATFSEAPEKNQKASCCEYRQFVKGFQWGRGWGIPINKEFKWKSDDYVEDDGAIDPVQNVRNRYYGYRSGVNDALDQYTKPDRATGTSYHALDIPDLILSHRGAADPTTTDVQQVLNFKGVIIDTCKMARGQFNETIDKRKYYVVQSKTWLVKVS